MSLRVAASVKRQTRVGWWRVTVAERPSLVGKLSLSCARPGKSSAAGQPTRQTQPFILSGSTNCNDKLQWDVRVGGAIW